MTLDKDDGDALTAAVAAGVGAGAALLGEITRAPWQVQSVALSHDDEGPFTDAHSSVAGDHYGSHFSFEGGRLLVLFSGKTGYLVTTAFTRAIQDQAETMTKRESITLGEVSNVILNPLIGRLAEYWGRDLIISAPETRIASPRDHLMRALSHYRTDDGLAVTFFARLDSLRLSSECRIMLFLDER